MPYTDVDLQLVRTARLRGIRSVQFLDRLVTYSSDAEMRQVELDIARELASVSQTRRKQAFGVATKGF
jgi:hypothetical protein